MTERYVLDLEELDAAQVALAGRQGREPRGAVADRGRPGARRLLRDDGRLPSGHGGRNRVPTACSASCRGLDPDDRQAIRTLSAEIRRAIEEIAIPGDIAAAITRSVTRLGTMRAARFAVRSSATAEDLPTASFAGQQDTYLNVVGPDSVLEHVSRCWASLFTERAVTYRLRNGFGHRNVQMAVVVQRMLVPHASGILFTADPVTSNRKIVSIEASLGLGEALVSGLVNPDVYQVRDGEIVARAVAAKKLAIQAAPGGGTRQRAIEPEARSSRADRCPGPAACPAGPEDRGALRPAAGHRMVPGGR